MIQTKSFYAVLTAFLFTFLTACAGDAQQRSTGEYIDDSAVTTRVKTALVNDPDVSAAEVKVQTYKGTVQLGGFVSDEEDINRAIEIARHVEGVETVENRMQVREGRYE
jgi:hyperosmotically inducible periplasmic protein